MGKPKRDSYSIHLGARGRIVLPAAVRRRLALNEGDQLLLTVEEDGRISLVSFREQARRCRGLLRDVAPKRSLAAELVAERRIEAGDE